MTAASSSLRSLAAACFSTARIVHRWFGIGACALCILWFLSGLVMMYVPFPAWTDHDRLSAAAPIDTSRLSISPASALASAKLAGPPSVFRLEMWGREPVYRLIAASKAVTVSAVDGGQSGHVSIDEAGQRLAAMGYTARALGEVDRDQWTVLSNYNVYRPLYLFALDDGQGTELYVSSRTGEIVQKTTSSQRFWNYLGSIPHWIYLTPIRSQPELWQQTILWLSGAVILLALSGLGLGVYWTATRLMQRRHGLSPFRGWLQWHHLAGLIGGVPLLTWIVTGWLSVNPFGLFASLPPLYQNIPSYYGLDPIPFAVSTKAVQDFVSRNQARQVTFAWLDRKPLLISDNGAGRLTADGRDGSPVTLSDDVLSNAAKRLLPQSKIAQLRRLTKEDQYWYSHRIDRPLPVVRIEFDDEIETWVHVDPSSGRILNILDREQRVYRWVFNLFHSFDLLILIRNRPLWDVVMVLLLFPGLMVSVTGVVVGWRALGRTLTRGR